jgi:hypothetical protein
MIFSFHHFARNTVGVFSQSRSLVAELGVNIWIGNMVPFDVLYVFCVHQKSAKAAYVFLMVNCFYVRSDLLSLGFINDRLDEFEKFLFDFLVIELEDEEKMISEMVRKLRKHLMVALPDFGKHLGNDGKSIDSYSTGQQNRESGQTSDL